MKKRYLNHMFYLSIYFRYMYTSYKSTLIMFDKVHVTQLVQITPKGN